MIRVKDFYTKIDNVAPFVSSYSWDNTGLLIGKMDSEVKRVLISLDVTEGIVDYAIQNSVDLIISHHPLIFQAIKSITNSKYLKLIAHNISVICAHTNLDISRYGVNYTLAKLLDLEYIFPLSMSSDIMQYQISVYVPNEDKKTVLEAMHNAGAGIIGNYKQCAVSYDVNGQFMPSQESNPYSGKINLLELVNESKLEMMCEHIYLNKVIQAMLKVHPYETPVYTIIPLKQNSQNYGLGCYGELNEEITIKDFSEKVKNLLQAPFIKLWLANKKFEDKVSKIAVCGGSGSSLTGEAFSKADLYISSDFTYHHFIDSPMPIIDAGHFFTENPVTIYLKKLLDDLGCEILLIDKDKHDISKLHII